jgi:hypothetical protein
VPELKRRSIDGALAEVGLPTREVQRAQIKTRASPSRADVDVGALGEGAASDAFATLLGPMRAAGVPISSEPHTRSLLKPARAAVPSTSSTIERETYI